jgi:acyl-CoA synthetase (AMP-forming)/AMP-acid ligase II
MSIASPSIPCSLAHLLRLRAAEIPEKIAYTFLEKDLAEGGHCIYRDLDRQARAIAAHLRERCQAGDRALLVYSAGLEFVAAFFACMYAKVIAIPVPVPDYRRIAPVFFSIAQDAQARVLLTTTSILQGTLAELKDGLPRPMDFMATDSISSGIPLADPIVDEAVLDTSVAYLQYTSGSTSKPRGVIVTHAGVLNNLRAIDADFRHDDQSVSLTPALPRHGPCLWNSAADLQRFPLRDPFAGRLQPGTVAMAAGDFQVSGYAQRWSELCL